MELIVIDPMFKAAMAEFDKLFELPARPQTAEEAKHHPNSPFAPNTDAIDDARSHHIDDYLSDGHGLWSAMGEVLHAHQKPAESLLHMVFNGNAAEQKEGIAGLRALMERFVADDFDKGRG